MGGAKITEEGCKTHQKCPKRGAKLIIEGKRDDFLLEKYPGKKLEEKLSSYHISMVGGR